MIRQHAGQVLIAGFEGAEPPATLIQRAAARELGGFILFKRNVTDLPSLVELNRHLIAAFPAAAPPLLMVDQEGGRVRRVGAPVLQLPSMRELSRRQDLALTRAAARMLSGQLRQLGFNLNAAPVLDVDTNPDNPVIGDRSFGVTVEQVVSQARALAAGMADAGIASCGKHFPGHGDTELDSHLALPRVRHGLSRLQAVELSPFAELAAELPSMMTSHIVFDALDPQVPATLSAKISTELLRSRLGFRGLLFSDDMDMAAIAAHHAPGGAAVAAVAAGCDQLLMCKDEQSLDAAYLALVQQAEADTGFAHRLAQAAERSWGLRRHFRAEVSAEADPSARFAEEGEELQAQLEVASQLPEAKA